MSDFFQYLAPTLIAVKDNPYGLVASLLFLLGLVSFLLLRNAGLKARVFGVILVAISSVTMSIAVLYQFEQSKIVELASGLNGSICLNHDDCNSKQCYPGPSEVAGRENRNYCISDSLNCALPGFDGAQFGTEIFWNSSKLTCENPNNGELAQFYRRLP